MAVTKILARKARLDIGIRYVLNGDKTEERVLTAHINCDPGLEYHQMLDTKRLRNREDGVQYYHIIQSFRPGEITPELALDIAREFATEHLNGYQAVIGVHVDKEHIHAHIVFNSVRYTTGEKYHSNAHREKFQFLRENGVSTAEDMTAFQNRTEETLASLMKQRTLLNVRKKKRRDLYAALADVEALALAKTLYADGLSGMEAEFVRYMEAAAVLEGCGIPRDRLLREKAELYGQVAEVNRQIRQERKKLDLCKEILGEIPKMEHDIQSIKGFWQNCALTCRGDAHAAEPCSSPSRLRPRFAV